MKKLIVPFVVLSSAAYGAANQKEAFHVDFVGASANTNTIFINTVESSALTSCSDNKSFRLPIDHVLAKIVVNMGMAAKTTGMRVEFIFDPTQCLSGGTEIGVVKLVD